MKERPILFSGPMIRAIREGRKTQTRRIVKPQPGFEFHGVPFVEAHGIGEPIQNIQCPYGQPGDRLWVRETFGKEWKRDAVGGTGTRWIYRATESDLSRFIPPWRSPIHMPRKASRITLEIVSVRVERLQDISEEDAKVEGAERVVMPDRGVIHNPLDPEDEAAASYRNGFQFIWECINGIQSWDANPWVWVVEFKEVTR